MTSVGVFSLVYAPFFSKKMSVECLRCPKSHSKEKSTHFMLYPVADYSLLLAGSKGFLLCKWTSSVCPPLSSELTPEPQSVQLQLKRKRAAQSKKRSAPKNKTRKAHINKNAIMPCEHPKTTST